MQRFVPPDRRSLLNHHLSITYYLFKELQLAEKWFSVDSGEENTYSNYCSNEPAHDSSMTVAPTNSFTKLHRHVRSQKRICCRAVQTDLCMGEERMKTLSETSVVEFASFRGLLKYITLLKVHQMRGRNNDIPYSRLHNSYHFLMKTHEKKERYAYTKSGCSMQRASFHRPEQCQDQ